MYFSEEDMKTVLLLPVISLIESTYGAAGFGGSDHDYTIKVHAGKRDCYRKNVKIRANLMKLAIF